MDSLGRAYVLLLRYAENVTALPRLRYHGQSRRGDSADRRVTQIATVRQSLILGACRTAEIDLEKSGPHLDREY